MLHKIKSLGLSFVIVLLVIGIGLGFLFGLDNPVPWILIAVLVVLPFIHKKVTARHFVAWDDKYSVGIKVIDDDHKKLMMLINNLQSAVLYPTDASFERQALDELVDYTKYHFNREETMMQQYGYPGFEEHKQQHDAMIAKVAGYLEAYEKDREGTVKELTQLLKDWLIRHISGTDQEYSGFLREKGVQ